jgi:hypothetical protein
MSRTTPKSGPRIGPVSKECLLPGAFWGWSSGLGDGDAAHLVSEAEPVGAVDVAGELDWL